jgi:hypothetical protein
MTEKLSPPNSEKVQQTVTKMRQVCREFDNLNLALDEVIAQVELEIRNSLLTAYRLGKKIYSLL